MQLDEQKMWGKISYTAHLQTSFLCRLSKFLSNATLFSKQNHFMNETFSIMKWKT